MKRYYSLNFRIIPEAKVWYFCLETEKTAMLGKNRYTVTDSTPKYLPKVPQASKNFYMWVCLAGQFQQSQKFSVTSVTLKGSMHDYQIE